MNAYKYKNFLPMFVKHVICLILFRRLWNEKDIQEIYFFRRHSDIGSLIYEAIQKKHWIVDLYRYFIGHCLASPDGNSTRSVILRIDLIEIFEKLTKINISQKIEDMRDHFGWSINAYSFSYYLTLKEWENGENEHLEDALEQIDLFEW